MSRNQKDESAQRRAEEDRPVKNNDEIAGRDPLKPPMQPPDESKPSERPDLDWAEHED